MCAKIVWARQTSGEAITGTLRTADTEAAAMSRVYGDPFLSAGG